MVYTWINHIWPLRMYELCVKDIKSYTYFSIFHMSCEHDNYRGFLFPHHSPKIHTSLLIGSWDRDTIIQLYNIISILKLKQYRICPTFDSNSIENELHIIKQCSKYDNYRKTLYVRSKQNRTDFEHQQPECTIR